MTDFLDSPHLRVLVGFFATGMSLWLLARRQPRLARVIVREVDRWSGLVIVILGMLVFVCGNLGFGNIAGQRADTVPFALYETFQVYAFNVAPEDLSKSPLLRTAMVCAMLLATVVAAKGIALLFHDSYVEIQLAFASRHTVIIGLGRIGCQLLADLDRLKDSRTIVVVELDPANPDLKWARECGVLTLIGDATRRESLEAAGLHRANEVFVVTGSDDCNIECVIELRDILQRRQRRDGAGRRRPPLLCNVHVLDRDLAEIVRARAGDLEQTHQLLNVEVFNALERTARRLLEDIATSTIDGRPIRPIGDDEVAHFVLLGFGEFGQTLAIKMAELAQFENGKRLRLTILDRDMESKARPFVARHSRLGSEIGQIPAWKFQPDCDEWHSKRYRPIPSVRLPDDSPGIEYVCNVQYIEYVEATDEEFLRGLSESGSISGVKTTILVCFEDDRQNFALAERLRAKLETGGRYWPIFVWIPRQRELSQLLADQRTKRQNGNAEKDSGYCDLIPFGQCYGSASYSEVTASWSDWLACHIHLIWMPSNHPDWRPAVGKLQEALSQQDPAAEIAILDWNELGEAATSGWQHCSEWQRASNRSAAIHAVVKAAAIGVKIEGLGVPEKTMTPIEITLDVDECLRRMEHYRWVAERLITGWRYASQRNDSEKTRWQITPWNNLDFPPQEALDSRADGSANPPNEKWKDDRIVKLIVGLMKIGRLRVSGIAANRTPVPRAGEAV